MQEPAAAQQRIAEHAEAGEACTLLTKDEAGGTLGQAVGPPRPGGTPLVVDMRMCAFETAGADGTLTLGLWSPGANTMSPAASPDSQGGGEGDTITDPYYSSAREAFDHYRQLHEEFGLVEVDEVGTAALWDQELKNLVVLADDRLLGVTVYLPSDDDGARRERERATWVAVRALHRMASGEPPAADVAPSS